MLGNLLFALGSLPEQPGLFLLFSAQQGTDICHWCHVLKHQLHLTETDNVLKNKNKSKLDFAFTATPL